VFEAPQTAGQNWFQRFLPRSSSKAVFLFVMTCYSFTLKAVIGLVIRLLGLWPVTIDSLTHLPRLVRPGIDRSTGTIVTAIIDPLVIAPIAESLVVIGIIELLRRLNFNAVIQILVSASLSCFLHSIQYPFWGFEVAPVFFIGAAAYVYWRRVSFWSGTQMIILLHFFLNSIVFISVTAERLHR
jgi:hypothetical protein